VACAPVGPIKVALGARARRRKPRDRSHFERFRSYHQRLYAQVEPTSITPFALPVVDRALHAALVAHVRIAGASALEPYPPPEVQVDTAARILRAPGH